MIFKNMTNAMYIFVYELHIKKMKDEPVVFMSACSM